MWRSKIYKYINLYLSDKGGIFQVGSSLLIMEYYTDYLSTLTSSNLIVFTYWMYSHPKSKGKVKFMYFINRSLTDLSSIYTNSFTTSHNPSG